jgi:hypothetical protein
MQKFAYLFLAIVATVVMVMSMGGTKKPEISSGSSTVAPTTNASPSSTIADSVPLPTGEDVISTFIQLINEQKIPDAIAMMDDTIIPSDSVKQQYGVIFNSFATILVQKIGPESFGKEDWGEGEERYRVELLISIKPQGQKGMWEEGVNTRWITVLKQQNRFMIHDIATGP